MFFTNKDKAALQHHIECLYRDIRFLTNLVEIEKKRVDVLLKVYPYGANTDGTPRKKPGRPRKVKA